MLYESQRWKYGVRSHAEYDVVLHWAHRVSYIESDSLAFLISHLGTHCDAHRIPHLFDADVGSIEHANGLPHAYFVQRL